MYGTELTIILIGTIGSAVAADIPTGVSVFVILGLWYILNSKKKH